MAFKSGISEGAIFNTNRCGYLKIIKYVKWNKIKIRFINTGYTAFAESGNIRKGNVNDPYAPSHQGVGFIGEGPYGSNSTPKIYKLWSSMLLRAYDKKYHEKHPSYARCSVVKRWHNLQHFGEDITKMPNWNTPGFELDKDLRVLGNKKYGPKYCSFVPLIINKQTRKHSIRMNPRAIISINNRNKHLGYFSSTKEADSAYANARILKLSKLAEIFKKDLHKDVYANLKG